jgi:hypothetical protein
MRRSTKPDPGLSEMRGEWRSEPTWPAERLRPRVWRPEGHGIDPVAVVGDVGVAAWISCAGKPPWGLPEDQRQDDARSLAYDWGLLDDELDVLGHPRVRLTVTSPYPVAFVSARLCDVFPDGTSALVSRGVLNLTHRFGHEVPVPLEPGVPTTVEVELEATSWIFEHGHRLRLALAGVDWPNTWPPPQGGTLEVDRSSVELELPVLDGRLTAPAPRFAPPPPKDPAGAEEATEEQLRVVRRVEREPEQTRIVTSYGFVYRSSFDARIEERYDGEVGVSTTDPGDAWAQATSRYKIAWPEAVVATEARIAIRSDASTYYVAVDVVAEEEGDGGIGRIARRFERAIPRRLQ